MQVTNLHRHKEKRFSICIAKTKKVRNLLWNCKKPSKTFLKTERYITQPFPFKNQPEIETHFDKWLYVLRHLNELDKIPPKLTERIFKKLFEVAEIAKFNREQLL